MKHLGLPFCLTLLAGAAQAQTVVPFAGDAHWTDWPAGLSDPGAFGRAVGGNLTPDGVLDVALLDGDDLVLLANPDELFAPSLVASSVTDLDSEGVRRGPVNRDFQRGGARGRPDAGHQLRPVLDPLEMLQRDQVRPVSVVLSGETESVPFEPEEHFGAGHPERPLQDVLDGPIDILEPFGKQTGLGHQIALGDGGILDGGPESGRGDRVRVDGPGSEEHGGEKDGYQGRGDDWPVRGDAFDHAPHRRRQGRGHQVLPAGAAPIVLNRQTLCVISHYGRQLTQLPPGGKPRLDEQRILRPELVVAHPIVVVLTRLID